MRFIILILCVWLTGLAHAQTYTVIHSMGKIYDTASGKYLSKGMRIDESAKLKFESTGAKAAVLSSSRGRFVIQQGATTTDKGELAYALSSVLSPARGKLSTRAGGINNKLDFEKKFAGEAVAILGNTFKVAVSPSAYPMDESHFFYASYLYNGEEINKKLSNEGDSLVVDVPTFYAIDGKPIDPSATSEAKLFYFDAAKEESTLITPLTFVVIGGEDVQYMMDNIGGGTAEEKAKGVVEVISTLYGKCSLQDVYRAL